MTPGTYIKTCRERAGLSRLECASRLTQTVQGRRDAAIRLAELEGDLPGDYLAFVSGLHEQAVFPFNLGAFMDLAARTCSPEFEELGA